MKRDPTPTSNAHVLQYKTATLIRMDVSIDSLKTKQQVKPLSKSCKQHDPHG
jgi:hypothetical protein